MENRTIIIVGIILLLVTASIFFYYFYLNMPGYDECADINSLVNLKYSSCYNSETGNLTLGMVRGNDPYTIKEMILFAENNFTLDEIPSRGEKNYNFKILTKPEKIQVFSQILGSRKTCEKIDTILLQNCTNEKSNISLDLQLSKQGIIENSSNNNSYKPKTGILYLSTGEDEEKNYDQSCTSNWICKEWEDCLEDVQKRSCYDNNSCFVETETPDFIRKCGECQENWKCSWSDCIDEKTHPDCVDLNNCGTEYSKPKELQCIKKSEESCVPNIQCGKWSDCDIDYRFENLFENLYKTGGTETRICKDDNNCLLSIYETKNCTSKLNIYTKRIKIGNLSYLEVYDKFTNKLIARINYNGDANESLNIRFLIS